ncbi:MAG: iron(III) transport system ATP-binding protein [Microbacteriaceae bacterium]|nr:iron(III) transport system ATP-binding protein [Microbacteriaceae bacterium]
MTTLAIRPERLETAETRPALDIRGLGKSYGRMQVLTDIDLQVEPGKFLVLLGPSGSGKSTLLRAIAGIERIDAGTIDLEGSRVSGGKRHATPEARELAMVFQDYALWPHLTVQQNVAFALRRRHLSGSEVQSRVKRMLERVDLADKSTRYPNELSGGQQQRVALARALVADPSLILFDEPLSNLDADLREKLRVEISTLVAESGATAVYITHDQAEAFALADEIAVLDGGRVIQRGRPEQIYRSPATPFVAQFTGLAGRFCGTISARTGDHVRVAIGEHAVTARKHERLSSGVPIEVLLRSTALSLREGEPIIAPAGRLPAMISELPATIVDVAYRGAAYDHVIDTPLGRLTGARDELAWARGTRCTVRIDANAAFAFDIDSRVGYNSR